LAGSEGKIISLARAVAMADPRLIPNLKLIIPLCESRVKGWKLFPTNDESVWTVTLGPATDMSRLVPAHFLPN
jgi:hypothetical protein